MLTWPQAVRSARRALWRHRVEAQKGGLGDETVDVDMVETALAWTLAESGDPWSHCGVVVEPYWIPAEATPWQRALLHAAAWEWEDVRSHIWGLGIADALGEHLGVNPPADFVEVFGVNLQTGADRWEGCPVCSRTVGLVWLWDGLIVRGRCPDGHAEWTPCPHLGLPVWERIAAAGTVEEGVLR